MGSMNFLRFAIALTLSEAFVKPISVELVPRTSDQSPSYKLHGIYVVPPCESGWTYFNETRACYKNFFSQTFNAAEHLCNTVGGHLTSIHSYEENLFVAELARSGISLTTCCAQATWIGLVKPSYLDINCTDSWIWTDGTEVDFLAWQPGHPAQASVEANQNCVAMYPDPFAVDKPPYKAAYQRWFNPPCNTQMRSFVCKKMALH